MRKDYIIDAGHGDSETDFVERFWTESWRRTGGVEGHAKRFAGRIDRIALKSEWRIIRRYLDRLPGRRLLDAGCGTGEWTRYLSERGYPTLGLDISRKTVAKLTELFPDSEFAIGDIRDTGLPEAGFDGVISWGTFEHFEDGLQGCIGEALRLLKPGGYLFITVPFDHLGLALKAAFERTPKDPADRNLRFFQWRLSRAELAQELRLGGFEVELLRPIHRRQGVVRFLHRTFGMDYAAPVTRALGLAIGAVMPRFLCAHMIMAVARKPEGAPVAAVTTSESQLESAR